MAFSLHRTHPAQLVLTTGLVAVACARFFSRRSTKRSSSPGDNDETTWELSFVQNMFFEACANGMEQIVACVEISGPIPSKEQLESAVKSLKKQDPNLAHVLIQKKDGTYVLQKSFYDECCSGLVHVVHDSKDWRKVAHKALNTIHFPKPTSDSPTGTWKVLIVPSNSSSGSPSWCLILVLNHLMFDGTSRNRLVCALLEQLDRNPSASTLSKPVPETPVDEITKHTPYMSWWAFGKDCVAKFQWLYRYRDVPTFYMDLLKAPGIAGDPTHTVPRQTRLILFRLTANETKAIVQASKQANTTVHGALSAAAILALLKLPEHGSSTCSSGGSKGHTVSPSSCVVSVGLTHLISVWTLLSSHIPTNALTGCYISLSRTTTIVNTSSTDTAQDDPWDMARSVKSQLQSWQPKSTKQFMYSIRFNKLLQYMNRKETENKPPHEYTKLQRLPIVAISNNGKVKLPDFDGESQLQVQACYAASARHNVPGNLAVWNVQTVGENM